MRKCSHQYQWRASITGVLAMCLCMCEKPPVTKGIDEPERSTLSLPVLIKGRIPVDRQLTDDQGRSLDATIVGRTLDTLQVVRKSDGLNAEISIAKLSAEDRKFAEELEVKPAPASFEVGLTRSSPDNNVDSYVQNRLDEIERLQEENRKLQTEAESTTNSMLSRSRMSTIRRNEAEIEKLNAAIKTFRSSK